MATKVTPGEDNVVQLLECWDEQLRKDLTRNAGGSLTIKTVDEVMAAINKLAVREENTMVARVQLQNICGKTGMGQYVVLAPACVAN